MFGVVFYREYKKGRESYRALLRERTSFILSKNEEGRLAGDYGRLIRSLYEMKDIEAAVVMEKGCRVLGSAPLNALPPPECNSGEYAHGWIYISFDDPYSEIGGVYLQHRSSAWSDVWRTFIASYLLFLLYSSLLTLVLVVWLRKYFVSEISRVVDSIRRLGRGGSDGMVKPEGYPTELVPLYEAMTLAVLDLEEAKRTIQKQSKMEAVAQVASEVGHDIRSPLAVLASVGAKLKDGVLSTRDRDLLVSATARIEEIASDLLSENREAKHAVREAASVLNCAEIATVLQALVVEKQAELQNRKDLEIVCRLAAADPSLMIRANVEEFKRVLSNLLNNAAEAIVGSGRILVTLEASGEGVCIEVSDTGRGLSEDEFDRAWNKGESVGKSDGNAIGLTQAKRLVALWGGTIRMHSVLGRGTGVTIELSGVGSISNGDRLDDVQVSLIENDTLVIKSWQAAAESRGINLAVFADPKEFFKVCGKMNRSVRVYIDVRLSGGENGVEVAREISKLRFEQVYLCTGDPPETFRDLKFLAGVVGKEFPDF